MADAKLILEEGGTYEYDFSPGLLQGFTIPAAEENEQGQSKKERGIELGMGDFERLIIPIAFEIEGETAEAMLQSQSTLLKALKRPRNVLTWNPDPDTCSDVYFDTYASPLDVPLDHFNQGFSLANLDLLADPHPYPAESTIFDTVTVLGQIDGESGEWTASQTGANAPVDSTRYRQGSKSARTEIKAGGNSWIQRSSATKYFFLGGGWITVWLYLDAVPTNLQASGFRIRIGEDSTHYFRYDFDEPYGEAAFHAGWQCLFFDFEDPTYTLNMTPPYGAFDYFYFEMNVASGDGPAFNIDNVHVVNGKACNVRGQTPLAVMIDGVGGEYDCGFKLDLQAGDEKKLIMGGDNGEVIGEYSSTPAATSLAFWTPSHWPAYNPEGASSIHYVWPSASTAVLVRNPTDAIDMSSLSSTGLIEFFIQTSGDATTYPTDTFEVRIGNDSSNYKKKVITNLNADIYNFYKYTCAMSDLVVGAGAVNWSNPIDYIAIAWNSGGGARGGQLWADGLRVYELGAKVDQMSIVAGSGLAAIPGVISIPESSPTAPTGYSWEATPAATALAGIFGGKYYRWTTAGAGVEKYIFPAKLMGDLYPGEHQVRVRLRTGDTGGGVLRLCGYDAYSGEWSFGEAVTVDYESGNWQTVDLGALDLPFDGWDRDAVPSVMYSYVGIEVASVGATKTWDINVMAVACVERGGRDFTPAVGRRFMRLDSRYHDSELYSQGTSSEPEYMSGARRRTTGDLLTAAVGVNNFVIMASDSSDPGSCSSIEITKMTAVERLKNGKA